MKLVRSCFILILCLKNSIFAGVSCNDIKNNLLFLELKLQNSCERIQPDGSCCDIDDGLNQDEKNKGSFNPQCITKKDLEAKYNQKMAELVIAEGFASMALAIEANHNALNDLTRKQIDKAKEKVEKLEKSLFIADLFYHATFDNTTTNGNKNLGYTAILFEDYDPSQNLEDFINQKCISVQFSNMPFCDKMTNSKNNLAYPDFLITLKGFLDLDDNTFSTSFDRNERFKKYQQSLAIKLGSNTSTLSPSDFLMSKHYKKILDLKDKLIKYGEAPTQGKATQILNLSKEIGPISVGYEISKDDPSIHTSQFLEKNFNDPLKQLDLPSLIIDGDFKEYFEGTKMKVSIDYNIHEKAFLERLKNNPYDDCSDLNCAQKKCQNKSQPGIGICPEYHSLIKHENVVKTLDQAAQCMQPSKKTDDKKNCLAKLAPKESSISTLKSELKRLAELRKRQDAASPFTELNLEKSMALHALSSNYCQDHFKKFSLNGIQHTDCGVSLELASDYEAYQLNIDGEHISISLNNQLMQETLAKLGKASDMNTLEKQFTAYCKEDRPGANTICNYYKDKEAFAVSMKNAQIIRERAAKRRAQRSKQASLKEEQKNNWVSGAKSFTKSFIKGLVNNSAPLVQSYFSLQAQEMQTANQLTAIQSYNTAYMNSLNAYLNANDPNNSQYFSSWGEQNLGSNYQSLSTFQQSNQSFAFRNPNNPLNFSFSIPGPVNPSDLIQTSFFHPPLGINTLKYSVLFLALQ